MIYWGCVCQKDVVHFTHCLGTRKKVDDNPHPSLTPPPTWDLTLALILTHWYLGNVFSPQRVNYSNQIMNGLDFILTQGFPLRYFPLWQPQEVSLVTQSYIKIQMVFPWILPSSCVQRNASCFSYMLRKHWLVSTSNLCCLTAKLRSVQSKVSLSS